MRELLIGAGNARTKKLWREGATPAFDDVVTLDIDPLCQPDVLWDLNERPLPFADEEFDQIHAYEVLEHVGRQGDWRGFFAEFSEYWRILAPAGVLILSCPKWDSPWAWGDPGHTRVIGTQCFTFLDQDAYADQVGKTAMTDYRAVWRHCFKLVHQSEINKDLALYALQKV
jgi:SAM-dependent methyltransferase